MATNPTNPTGGASPLADKPMLMASVDVDINGYVGIGAPRDTVPGLNWAYGAVDLTAAGAAGLKFLRGETLTEKDQVVIRFQGEIGDLDKLKGIGPLLKRAMPEAAQADAGVVVKIAVSGDGKGGLRIAQADAFAYVDIPNNGGLVSISPDGKPGPGTKPDQGFTNVTLGARWTPEKGLQPQNNDVLNGQIVQLFKPPADAVDAKSPVWNGWTVMGVTYNDNRNVLAPMLQNQFGRVTDGKGTIANQAVSGIVGAGEAIMFFGDVAKGLDGHTVAKVSGGPNDGKPLSATAIGVVQGMVQAPGQPVGLFLRGQGAITTTLDGKDTISLNVGGQKIGSTSMGQINEAGRNLFAAMEQIPIINSMVPDDLSKKPTKPQTQPEPVTPYSNMYRAGKDSIGLPGGQLQFDYFEYTGAGRGKAYAHGPNGTKYETPDVAPTRDAVRGAFIKMYEGGGINDLYKKDQAPKPEQANPYANMYRAGKDSIGLPGGQLQFDYFEYTGAGRGKAYAHGPNGTKYETPDVAPTRDAVRGAFIKMYEGGGINDLYRKEQSYVPNSTVAQVVVTAEGRSLQLAMDGNALVVRDRETELMRFKDGTTVAQARELVESQAIPLALRGQGTPAPDAPTQVAIAPEAPKRDTEQPKISIS